MKPWDARLASHLIRPLRDTPVTPNHLTTVRLLTGIAAAAAFASGVWPNLAAILFALSNLLDHTDGELARLTGMSSRAGHVYDLISDAIVHVPLFVSIGIGLWIAGQGRGRCPPASSPDWQWPPSFISAMRSSNGMEKRKPSSPVGLDSRLKTYCTCCPWSRSRMLSRRFWPPPPSGRRSRPGWL